MDYNGFSFIQSIGLKIDELDIQSGDKEKSFNEINLELVDEIEDMFEKVVIEKLTDDNKIIYYYTHANYMAVVKRLVLMNFKVMKSKSCHVKDFKDIDSFKYNNYFERIREYRISMKLVNSGTDMMMMYTSQIYVNYANILLEMGRVAESIQVLTDYNKIIEGFPMARGNLAIKHMSLATRTADESVMRFLLDKGLSEMIDVCDNADERFIPLDVLEQFYDWELHFEQSIHSNLSNVEPWNENKDVDDEYKIWCAKNRLSLNYINLIYPIGNVDDIHMPNMGLGYFGKENNMEYYAWFNTIKQEYNMARYFLYKIKDMEYFGNNHMSQNHNTIINTMDYPALGYVTEMFKSSLKTSYSVLDKIGMFCCHFHQVKMKVQSIDFHRWYQQIDREVALKSPFNALYWLSQDLDRKNGEKKDIRLLRNVIEHRYIRVLEHYDKSLVEELEEQKYEYFIDFWTLEEKAYETLRLVRNAIFYMSSGFNIQYNRFFYNPDREYPFIPLRLSTYEDGWKN